MDRRLTRPLARSKRPRHDVAASCPLGFEDTRARLPEAGRRVSRLTQTRKPMQHIIDRDTSQGRLTATMSGTQIALYLDGDFQTAKSPRGLTRKESRQLPDEFTHIAGPFPITQEEYGRYESLVEPVLSEEEQERREIKYRLEEINRTLDEAEGGPRERRLRKERDKLEQKLYSHS